MNKHFKIVSKALTQRKKTLMENVVIKAPGDFSKQLNKFSVFLAGSIEMGKAENWQEKITRLLADKDIVILNPRRDDWDSSWKQTKDDPQFSEQVKWELDAQEKCSAIAMNFDPSTKSPITLLELGLAANSKKLIVHCPEGFWRKGNVDIVCERYGVQTVNTIDELVTEILKKYEETSG